jgi:hypothetical protein
MLFLTQLFGSPVVGDLDPPQGNDILLIFVDATNLTFEVAHIHPDLKAKGIQTATGNVDEIGAHDEKIFYLVFPPGKGSMTITKVAHTGGENSGAFGPVPLGKDGRFVVSASGLANAIVMLSREAP